MGHWHFPVYDQNDREIQFGRECATSDNCPLGRWLYGRLGCRGKEKERRYPPMCRQLLGPGEKGNFDYCARGSHSTKLEGFEVGVCGVPCPRLTGMAGLRLKLWIVSKRQCSPLCTKLGLVSSC